MMFGFLKRKKEKERREAHERELKERLAKKIEQWRENSADEDITNNLYLPKSDNYTELTIDDRKVRIERDKVEKIVLNDVWSAADPADSGRWKRNR